MTIAERAGRAAWLRGLAVLAAVAAVPAGAMAQAPARGAAPPPAAPAARAVPVPDRTTASYGDWTLRCQQAAGAEGRSCDVMLTVLDQRAQPLVQLVMRRGPGPANLVLTAQVGVSATVSEPARLLVGETAISTLPFQRCLVQGCFAEVQQEEAQITGAAGQAEALQLQYRNGEGAPLAFPIPLRGLAAALQALRAM